MRGWGDFLYSGSSKSPTGTPAPAAHADHASADAASRAPATASPPAPMPHATPAPPVCSATAQRGPRRRVVLVDLGDVRTQVRGYDLTGGEPVPIGRAELESAVLPGELPARIGATRGLRTATSERVEMPRLLRSPRDPERWLMVGQPAATLGGVPALVAGGPTEEKIEAILSAAVLPFARSGDRVELVCVDAPNGAQAPLGRVLEAWSDLDLELTGLCHGGGEPETHRVHLETQRVPAGDAALELAYEQGFIEEGGPPAVILDLGHQTSRFYLVDFEAGLLDLFVLPHGGRSFLVHANRYADERGWRPGGDVDLLRQLDDGTDMLGFGGMTFVTERFFALPREELAKAIAAELAKRLFRHAERGGRWPGSLLVMGGPAKALLPELRRRLAARRLTIGSAQALPKRPSPLLDGAWALWPRLAPS